MARNYIGTIEGTQIVAIERPNQKREKREVKKVREPQNFDLSLSESCIRYDVILLS